MITPGSANPLLMKSAATSYTISRSLRFNSADSAYLSRTPASAGNRKTWTWAGWVKRSALSGTRQGIFGSIDGAASAYLYLEFDASEKLTVYDSNTGGTARLTSAVYRDVSGWYHIVLAYDTTQATANNRIRLYVNGVEVTSFSGTANPAQNSDGRVNTANAHSVGSYQPYTPSYYFNGYLADIHFIDGQALTPTSFGEFDTNGIWQPKAYTGSYGTNGFKLDFSDNSAATATTLGKDTSGNGNNWTPTNLSVTAGAGNDSLVDTPTNYGTDTGAGGEVRGNYCTLNLLAESGTSGSFALSNGNLDATYANRYGGVPGTIFVSSGKWYWEVTIGSGSTASIGIGTPTSTQYPGFSSDSYAYYGSNGNKYTNNAASAYGSTFTAGDVIGVALNLDSGTLVFYKNNVSQGTAFSGLSGLFGPRTGEGAGTSTHTFTVNFGQRPFAYTAPSGFKALCTATLPAPTITKGSNYFDTVLYTGTGSSLTPTSSLGFSPDLVWIKGRSGATDNTLYDSVRGAQARLESNNTDAEVTTDGGLTAFSSNGFTLGTLAQVNTNTATYAGWCWDAGSSSVTNTAGSITSSVRANASAGFSIVTADNVGSGTIGHGLGVNPSIIIIKSRDVSGIWNVQGHILPNPAADYLRLNQTSAKGTDTSAWNNTAATSSVFSVNATYLYGGTPDLVAFCFAPVAGYSAFGSYTGNGSADGPFVFCGFRPAYVLIKYSSATGGSWMIYDSKRGAYNLNSKKLAASAALQENDGANFGDDTVGIDFLSNGFKIRTTGDNHNTSSGTYVYAAFAEHPFSLARAR